jgi:hypothetical protein
MKFQFCGNLNIPEWFLSQLNLLSKLSALKLRKIAGKFLSSIIEEDNSTEIVSFMQ